MVADDGSLRDRVMGGMVAAPGAYMSPTPVEVVYRMKIEPPSVRMLPVTETKVSSSPGNVNFEIMFNGIDGQGIRLQYREYTSEDLARAAFSQDLSYPLTARNIRFRRVLIEVERVDEQSMTYKVVEDGLN